MNTAASLGFLALIGAGILAMKKATTGFSFDNALVNLVKGEEGLRLEAYQDPGAGKAWTIGWGHKIIRDDGFFHPQWNPNGKGKPGNPITRLEADLQLMRDMQWAVNCVNQNVKVQLTQNQRNALISLTYNIGCVAFSNSTLLKKLNAGDYSGAYVAFDQWIYDDGKVLQILVNRRNREQELWNA